MPDPSRGELESHLSLIRNGVRAVAAWHSSEPPPDLNLPRPKWLLAFSFKRVDGVHEYGFAAEPWAAELFEWATTADIPKAHAHRIRGLLLGYSPLEIRAFEERMAAQAAAGD